VEAGRLIKYLLGSVKSFAAKSSIGFSDFRDDDLLPGDILGANARNVQPHPTARRGLVTGLLSRLSRALPNAT
jgi:hypothetical protein